MRRFAGPGALILAATLAFWSVSLPAWATPSTTAIESKKAEAAAASKALDDLNATFEMKVEEYDSVTEALDSTRQQIEVTRAQLEDATRRLERAQDRLAVRALAIYTGGEIDAVAVLMGTSSFDDFMTRLDLLNRISLSDADLVREVTGYRVRIASAEAALENREVEQVALRQQAEARKVEVESALRAQQGFVAGLKAEVASLVRAEEERQKAVAAEMARRAAEEAARRASSKPRGGSGAAGAAHGDAVTVGLRYLGVPYVWGGASPSTGFDCSGLTSYVYGQMGIQIPRTSRSQFDFGGSISADRVDLLAPGDLVFFGYDGDPDRVHHVGIYVGSGNYLHAPGTGDRVKVSSLTERIASRGDYVGAARP